MTWFSGGPGGPWVTIGLDGLRGLLQPGSIIPDDSMILVRGLHLAFCMWVALGSLYVDHT